MKQKHTRIIIISVASIAVLLALYFILLYPNLKTTSESDADAAITNNGSEHNDANDNVVTDSGHMESGVINSEYDEPSSHIPPIQHALTIEGSNREASLNYSDNRILLPYGDVLIHYTNYIVEDAVIEWDSTQMQEFVASLESMVFYDSFEEFKESGIEMVDGNYNLGMMLYMTIENPQCQNHMSLSLLNDGRVVLTLRDGDVTGLNEYFTLSGEFISMVKELTGWVRIDPSIVFGAESISIHDNASNDTIQTDADTLPLEKQFTKKLEANGHEIRIRSVDIVFSSSGNDYHCVIDTNAGLVALEQQIYFLDDEFRDALNALLG